MIVDRLDHDGLGERRAEAPRRVDGGLHDVRGAGPGEPGDTDHDRGSTGAADPHEAILGAFNDLRDAPQRDPDTVRADRDGHLADVLECLGLRVGEHRDELAIAIDTTHRGETHAGTELVGDVRRRHVQRRCKIGIEDHLDLTNVAAQHLDAAYARDARERRTDHELRRLAQLTRVDGAGDVEGDDGKRSGGDLLGDELGLRGEPRTRLRNARLHELQRAPHVRVGRELQRDLGRTADRPAPDALHAEDRREALLERPGHGREEHVRRRAASARDHHDARELHLRVDAARHLPRREAAEHDEQRRREPHDAGTASDEREELHGARLMGASSSSARTCSTATASLSVMPARISTRLSSR